jgi:SAM-dependent methyltransferase
MTIKVLQHQNEITSARRQMRKRGASILPPRWVYHLLTTIGLSSFLRGDLIKSWDIWETACFLEKYVSREESVIDLGAYRSEILHVLHRIGFASLHGVDLNPELIHEPHYNNITYTVGDFHCNPYANNSFAAITSISAIEHGHDQKKLLREVARLLKSGGYFICSTDYWPEKISTHGARVLGMNWTIFSTEELRNILVEAQALGLYPVGPLEFEASQPTVHYSGKSYTFAWFVLRKIEAS